MSFSTAAFKAISARTSKGHLRTSGGGFFISFRNDPATD
jgi:hypothetical protein